METKGRGKRENKFPVSVIGTEGKGGKGEQRENKSPVSVIGTEGKGGTKRKNGRAHWGAPICSWSNLMAS